MLKGRVDEELLLQAQVAAIEAARERDGLRESNALLAQRLSRVQETLSRARREKAALEAQLAGREEGTTDPGPPHATADALRDVIAQRSGLLASVATLEGIVEEARADRARRDEEHQRLLQRHLALQRELQECREVAAVAAKKVRRSPDHLDELCERDRSLAAAAAALGTLDRLKAAITSVVQELSRSNGTSIERLEERIVASRVDLEDVVAADAAVIAHLKVALAAREEQLTTAQRDLAGAKESVRGLRTSLQRAEAQLTEKASELLELRTERLATPHTDTVVSKQMRSLLAELEATATQLADEQAARARDAAESGRQLRQSLDLQQRLTAYVHCLEAAQGHKDSHGGDDNGAGERLHAIDRSVTALSSDVQRAVARIRQSVRLAQERAPSVANGLSSSRSRSQSGKA